MDVPKVWLDRDPRNQRHVRAAMELFAELDQDTFTTKRTVDELAELGIKLGKNIKIKKRIPCESDVIGGFFFLDTGLFYPDNVMVTCSTCHAALQIRPRTNVRGRKLCCFCALDEALKEYWAKLG